MGLRFPEQIFGKCFFITTAFDHWERFGDRTGVYNELASSLTFCIEKYNALLPAYVFMPSHVHILVALDGYRLGDMMRDFKKYVAQKAMRALGVKSPRIWRPRYDRLVVFSEETFLQKLNYIHQNPVKAKLVDVQSDWPWSSAPAYTSGEAGPVPVWTEWFW